MTSDGVDVDEPVAATDPGAEPADTRPAALIDYLARMRRQRRIYFAALAVLVIAVVVGVQIVLRTGEIAHATLHEATSSVPAPADSTASATLTQAWHSSDSTARGVPFDQGTVITYDQHTVTGRNYATGAAVWSYTRTDLSTCTVFQEAGITMAIFTDRDGFCDEVNAFNTSTGARDWYRTLDSNGNTITSTNEPTFSISQYTLMITTPLYIQAVDPSSGEDRWTFIDPGGCTNTSAVQGSGGILIAEHCTDGDHLVLRDPYASDDNDDKAKAKWRVDVDAIPVSADQLISALDPATGRLRVYSPTDGKVSATQTLDPAPTVQPAPTIVAFGGDRGELVSVGPNSYLLDIQTGQQLWSAPVSGLTNQTNNPLTITGQGVTEIDGTTGSVSATHPIPAPPAGSTATRLGSGFVIAGPSTTVYH